ncbi:MAG: SanA/YdcF family protein [Verrucomicrobiales bacterium]
MGSTHRFIAKDADSARMNEVALVLGTSKKVAPKRKNQHFENRLRMAAELYRKDKAQYLLVSGDNRSKYYNEPQDMRDALVDMGIPGNDIRRDFAGLRTLDSMVRAHEIFQLDTFTVVTDGFHLPRAIFIGRHYGMDVTGVASKRVPFRTSFKTEFRECFARVKAVLDVHLLGTRPHHGGDPEPILVNR